MDAWRNGQSFNLINKGGYLYWNTLDAANANGMLADGSIGGVTAHSLKLGEDNSSSGVGQPGEWESLIPIWGSGRAAVDHFQNGNYWRGLGYTALAVSDVFLVKSIATGIGRGAWKLGSHSWSATRSWLGKNGYAGAGQHVHHWAITQKVSKKYGLEAIANQPWNLKAIPSLGPFTSGTVHRAVHGNSRVLQFNSLQQIWYGTPTWLKAGAFSTVGHGVQFGSY